MSADGAMAAMRTAIEVVEEQQGIINGRAEEWTSDLSAALKELSSIRVGTVQAPTRPLAPTIPNLSVKLDPMPTYKRTDINLPQDPSAPSITELLTGLDSVAMDPIPNAPEMPVLGVPNKPVMNLPSAPVRPDVDTQVDLPAKPVIDLPQLQHLKDIPDFTFDTLPDFNGVAPSLDLAPPNVFINWAEPQYESEVLNDLTAWVRRYMQGGTGLPPHVEDALFARSRDRISAETRKAVQEAVSTFAARGFSLPQGAMAKMVSVAQEQGRTQAAELNRDTLIEVTKLEIENIRFAVQQGIALEQLTTNLHENTAKRLFEVAKFGAEALITVFNAQVGLFNAQVQAFNSLQAAFRVKLDRALARLEVWKTQAQSVQAHNQNAVEVFKAEYIAVQQAVETFKALMDGAKTKAGVIESQINSYRADVQAFSERVNAEKVKFDAYESEIKGETAKASMFEAQSRAFASTVQAISNKADIKVRGKQLQMEGARVLLAEYQTKMGAWTSRVDANLKMATNGVQAFGAEVEAWRAGAGANTAQAEMLQRFSDMQTRTNISYAEMQMSEFNSKMQHAVQTAQIALEAAKAMGQFSAQLAAGAMSAMHVSAGVSGSGSQSGSWSRSDNYSYQGS